MANVNACHLDLNRWQFDPSNPTAHAAWNAFYHHLDQKLLNSQPWDPYVVSGI